MSYQCAKKKKLQCSEGPIVETLKQENRGLTVLTDVIFMKFPHAQQLQPQKILIVSYIKISKL